MYKEQKKELKKELRKLRYSFCKINTILSQDCDGVYSEVNKKFDRMYPFDKSFDEITFEVDEWIEDMYPSLKIVKGTAIYTGGGIYNILGKLNDGKYIFANDQFITVIERLKNDESNFLMDKDNDYDYHYCNPNWLDERDKTNEYQISDLLRAIKKFCKDLDKGKGDLYLVDEFENTENYSPGELKRMVYDSLKECY